MGATILSDLALNLGAGIAIEIFKNFKQSNVQSEIGDAFEEALIKFYEGRQFDEKGRIEIKTIINKIILNPTYKVVNLYEDPKYGLFFSYFNESIAKRTAAYNYLKEIKDFQRFMAEMRELEQIKNEIVELRGLIKASPNSETLIQEYQRQIQQYGENINSFNPSIALKNLEALEQSFVQNGFTPDNALKARILFFKAKCLKLMQGRIDDYYKTVVKAYDLNRNDVEIREAACFSFYKLNDKESLNLSREIITEDRYNPVANAVNVLSIESSELVPILENLPKQVVQNLDFKRLIYISAIGKEIYLDLNLAFEKFEITNVSDSFINLPNTVDNYGRRSYILECKVKKLISNSYIYFYKDKISSKIDPNSLDILSEFLNGVEGTELESNFYPVKFYRYYYDFLINSKTESVYFMRDAYDKFTREKENIEVMMLANSLQQIDEIDDALKLLNEFKNKTSEMMDLELFCYQRKGDSLNFVSTIKEFLNSLKLIDKTRYVRLFDLVVQLSDFNILDSFDTTCFIHNKEFDDQCIKVLLNSLITVLRKEGNEETIKELVRVEDDILRIPNNLSYFLGFTYYELRDYKRCTSVYEKILDFTFESRELFLYIHSLSNLEGKSQELLDKLAIWRDNFSRNDSLLKLELELRIKLYDFETSRKICQKFFEENKSDDFVIANYAVILHDLEDVTKNEFLFLIELSKDRIFSNYNYARRVAFVLFENNFKFEAFEIYFKFASDPLNSSARQDYFMACLKMPENKLESFDFVEENHHLKYEIDNNVQFTQIIKGSDFSNSVIGAKVGEKVRITGKIGNNSREIKILRIMNKYLRLHDEIYEEVNKDPFSGIKMESIDISDYIDGNKNFLDFLEGFGRNKGYDPNKLYNDYSTGKVSFLEIVEAEYSNNFIRGFLELKYTKKGLFEIPLHLYPEVQIDFYDHLILDFSSVIKLFDFQLKNGIQFSRKFVLAKSVYSVIKAFSREGLTYGNTEFVLNLDYYEKLMVWIKNNCELKMSYQKLDVSKRLAENSQVNFLKDLLFDGVLLAIDSNKSLLISDEILSFRFMPINSGRIVSSEKFLELMKK